MNFDSISKPPQAQPDITTNPKSSVRQSERGVSIKKLDLVERQKSFQYYKPNQKSLSKTLMKELNCTKRSTKYAFTNCLLENENELESKDDDCIKSYLNPLPGEGSSQFQIALPPSRIEDSITRYCMNSAGGSFKAKALQKS